MYRQDKRKKSDKKKGDSDESPHKKGCGERLTILQGHAAFKGYGGKLTILQSPTQNTGFPQCRYLHRSASSFYYLFLKTPGRKDARTPEKPFLL